MTKRSKILVPEARPELDQMKVDVLKQKGYDVDASQPDSAKYEIAKELGIPLSDNDNGDLTARQAGKIGGPIGGNMVKEMIRLAQQQLAEDNQPKL
ncbi:alpha/beta-type small acid-soluble spore protein [Sporosarcina sp. Te-1]|uniref:alpha/beta-type small acid-soluble spore protein n=1 Tax=Sporosarcina sp. Te-1 TaxID=2818390 RepID=UPI001A9DBC31|nr:alpha/beta-type small acid-soluble spore protein [Sporosarcina sp. Te-1]QTD41920.1 alpha/beta-type small acid-soluble spore protein [Sporosarcina sp. Te-1]